MKIATPRETNLLDQYGRTIFVQARAAGGPGLDVDFLRSARAQFSNPTSAASRFPYQFHSWTHACVDRIVMPTASTPKVLYNVKDKQGNLITEHPLLDLFMRPNPFMSGIDIWEYTLMCLMLPTLHTPGGQCFWHLESGTPGVKVNLLRGEIPKEIWPYSDNVIHPLIGRDGRTAIGWKMVVNGMTKLEFSNEEIIRIRLLNPYNMLQGMSPYAAASTSINQDSKSDEFNTKFYDNFGAIGGLLSTDSDTVTREELQSFAEYFEETYSGAGNAGKTAALAHGLKYDQFIRSNVDMQFMEQRKDNRLRIQAVYGVNEEEIGIYDKGMNRATAEQADRSVWQKTRLPLDRKIWDTLNIMWLRFIKPGTLRGKSDLSQIEALRPNYTDQIADAVKLIKEGRLTAREAYRLTGVPINDEGQPALDKVYLPRGYADVEIINEIGYIPSAMGNSGGGVDTGTKQIELAAPTQAQLISKALKDVVREDLWNTHVREVLDPGEKSMRGMINARFRALRNEMLDNVDAWLREQKKDVRALEINLDVFLFSLDGANVDLLAAYKPETRKQMERQIKKLHTQYSGAIDWKFTDKDVVQFVKIRAKYLKELMGTTKKQYAKVINEEIDKAVKNNLTPQETAKAIKKAVNEKTAINIAGRSKTIARTEVGSISNMSIEQSYKASQIDQQEWLSARDELVRVDPFNHAIDGEVRKLGEAFSNGLEYPLAAGGEAGNVCNCRCTTLPVFPEE